MLTPAGAGRLLAVGYLTALAVAAPAAPVRLANARVRFEVDMAHGVVLSGADVASGRAVYRLSGGVYRVGKPAGREPLGPFEVRAATEWEDQLVPDSFHHEKTPATESVVARYRNPDLADLEIEKRYSLDREADFLRKRVQIIPARDLGLGLEYSLAVNLDTAFRAGSYYHCPMGIHFGQSIPTYLPAAEVTGAMNLSGEAITGVGGGAQGMHSLVVCCSPGPPPPLLAARTEGLNGGRSGPHPAPRPLSAVTYRYRENDRFVRPSWVANLGSGIVYNAQGWEMGVFAGYLAPDRLVSGEVHLRILHGDHLTAHRRWQQLPGWQAVVTDPEVANDRSPEWLDRVKVMGMTCEGVTGVPAVGDNYVRRVNEGPKMMMVAGPGVTVWSGDGPVGTVYFSEGALYQKADGKVIHDADWFRRYLDRHRALDPAMKLGLYFLSPDISSKYSTQVRGYGGTWLGPWEGLTVPGDIARIEREWAGNMRAHNADFIYMDGAAEGGGAIDYDRKVSYHNYDALALDKAVRAAARSLGPDRVYWRNGDINVYTDCGFAELSGYGSWAEMVKQTGWRNLADRLLKVKLYERTGKWVAPLYASTAAEYVNYALGLGCRPWGSPGWPLVNAMYEVRNLRLMEADITPCWWLDGGDIEAYALTLGASRFLMALNHREGEAARVEVSADTRRLGLPAGQPLYLWECAPAEDMAVRPGLDDHAIQTAWGRDRWAAGTCVRRRLERVLPRPGERVGAELNLPYNRLRQVVATPVPGLIYAAHGYRRHYPLTDFCDLRLRGNANLAARRLWLSVENGEGPAEVALVAPASWRFVAVKLDGRPVAFEAVPEEGASLAVVAVGEGKHTLVGQCEMAPEVKLRVVAQESGTGLGQYVPGAAGEGLYVGERCVLSLSDLGPWDLSRGSVEFSFRPDFASTGDTSHVLLGLHGERGSLFVYKLLNHDGLCFNINAGGKDYSLHAPGARWEAGTWHRVKVVWDRAGRFEELTFDGAVVQRVERDVPDLSGWTGALRLGRRPDDLWIAPAALDDLTVKAGDQVLLRMTFDGDLRDGVSGREATLLNMLAAGSEQVFSFGLEGLPTDAAPMWQLTRDRVPMLTQMLQATHDAKLSLPPEAEAGAYELRVGAIGCREWPLLARFSVQPRTEYRDLSRREDRDVDFGLVGQRATHLWTHASYGAGDPTCRAEFHPDKSAFRLAAGTGYDQANAAAAGIEVSGLKQLGFEFTESDDVRQPRPALTMRAQRGPNTFTGLTLDYHTPGGWRHRVACGLGGLTRRSSTFPNWGWGAEPAREALAVVDLTEGRKLGQPRRFLLDLQALAPADWDGRLIVSAVLQECLLTTEVALRLLPPEDLAGLQPLAPRPLDLSPVIHARRLAAPPSPGGQVDEGWQGLPALAPFYDLGNLSRAVTQTRAYVAYDARGLYVAADCDDLAVLATQAGPDANVWADDEVEVFVQPAGSAHYYQFAANPLGSRFDTRSKEFGYNADWQAEAARREGGWTVVFRLPWVAMEAAAPTPGARWRLAVCRTNRGGEEFELSTWPIFAARDFHLPESFAPLLFE